MFGQLIDALIKHDDDRQKIIKFILKVLFTTALTAKLYELIFGAYSIILITDVSNLFDFFLNGQAIICFALFFLTWTISFGFTWVILCIVGMWAALKLYDVIIILVNNSDQIVKEPAPPTILKLYSVLLNAIDIFEIENSNSKPGRNFYKFYDYLVDIQNDKKSIHRVEFSDTISLGIQFLVLYRVLDLNFLTTYWWLNALTIVILFIIFFNALLEFIMATLVEFKYGRLLNLMRKIDPEYTPTKPSELITK